MSYLPINIEIQGRNCLVVGGGEVGVRKVDVLLKYGASVKVVSRDLDSALEKLVDDGRVEYLGEEFSDEHLEGVALVFAATDDAFLNKKVSLGASDRNIPVNVADQPELCSFIVPASIRRGDLTISISTNGRSPALSAAIRAELEKEFGPEYGEFLRLMGIVREKKLSEGRPSSENRKIFRQLVSSNILELLAELKFKEANGKITELLGESYSFESLGFKPDLGVDA